MVSRRDLLAGAALALVVSGSASGQGRPSFDGMVVLGDSLSDTGNAGRFSNGPVWVEVLAQRLNLSLRPSQRGGTNFAVGGARLDPRSGASSLRAQATTFLGRPQPPGRVLHVVYGGGNDLLAALGHPAAASLVQGAVVSLRSIVADLLGRGATDLLVPNLPDVGMTPEVRGHGRGAMEAAAKLSAAFNQLSDEALRAVVAGFGAPRLYRLDVHAMGERVRADPASLGFTDIATPCGGRPRCDGHLFWDGVHPTAQAHARLGEEAFRLLADGPR